MDSYKAFYETAQKSLNNDDKFIRWKNFFEVHGLYPMELNDSILEIGCSDGTLLQYLTTLGYTNLSGIEYDRDLAEEASLKHLQVSTGDAIEILKTSTDKYDAIYLFDVLEHIEKENQIEFLKLIYSHLTSKGFLALSVPNALTPISSYFRYADFTHKCAYTSSSLNYVITSAGFPNPSIRSSHLENISIKKLKKAWYDLCKQEFGMSNIILTPNLFAVAYKEEIPQMRYNKNYPVLLNDYEFSQEFDVENFCLEAKNFLRKFLYSITTSKAYNQTTFSLGCNCFPRSILARYNLIKTREEGYLSLPFDLAVTPLKSVIHFIQNDFKGFFDDIEWHKDLNCWYNPKFGCLYLHDGDCNRKDFVKRYKNRIKNYRKINRDILKKCLKPVFVYHIDPLGPENNSSLVKNLPFEYFVDTKEDFQNLYDVLTKRYKDFKLIVIDTINCIQGDLNEKIQVIKVDIPSKDYAQNWYKEEYFNSDKGIYFESTIASAIKAEGV